MILAQLMTNDRTMYFLPRSRYCCFQKSALPSVVGIHKTSIIPSVTLELRTDYHTRYSVETQVQRRTNGKKKRGRINRLILSIASPCSSTSGIYHAARMPCTPCVVPGTAVVPTPVPQQPGNLSHLGQIFCTRYDIVPLQFMI